MCRLPSLGTSFGTTESVAVYAAEQAAVLLVLHCRHVRYVPLTKPGDVSWDD